MFNSLENDQHCIQSKSFHYVNLLNDPDTLSTLSFTEIITPMNDPGNLIAKIEQQNDEGESFRVNCCFDLLNHDNTIPEATII